jgi:type IV pilus assembly protein PilB
VVIKKRLGEMLVEEKLISPAQLDKALKDNKNTGLKLGQFLTRQGLISEAQMVDLLSRQLKISKYHPGNFPLDFELVNIIPFETAKNYQIAPLAKKGRLLTIAMVDPLDINALDTIEVTANCEVEAVVCTEMEMVNLHKSLYREKTGFGGVVDSLADVAFEKEVEQAEEVQVDLIQNMAVQTPAVIRLVDSLFINAVQERASDIHISPQQNTLQIRLRIDGRLHSMPAPPKSMFLPVITRIKILSDMDITQSRIPQDGRFTIRLGTKAINVRASTVPTIHGENVVLRLLDTSSGIFTLDRLGMSTRDEEMLKTIVHKPYGMVLSTGPTGSGKTSSLFAILHEINTPDVHIITLEDPVEYKIDTIRQIQLNTKAGMTFAGGLRAILRQDPDIIMVGEIRDAETAAIAVKAAQTGHRVLSTVHTNDAAGAVARLMDMGIEPFLVSSVLLVSFAQRLIRTICPYCKEPYTPPEAALVAWGLDDVKEATFMHGKGCQQCMHTGFKGRVGVFEVLVNDDVIQEMIMRKASAHEIVREAVSSGKMRTLQQEAAKKVALGLTTLEEAMATVVL